MLLDCQPYNFLLFLNLGIPDPVIIITAIGSNNISDNYTLMCSVDIVIDLLNQYYLLEDNRWKLSCTLI